MLENFLLGFGMSSNVATLLGLWIAYASAPTTIQNKVGHLLIIGGAACSIVLYLAIVWRLARVPAAASVENTNKPERRVFFFSPGVAVTLNRSAGTAVVYLHVLSTEPTELVYIRLHLTDTTGLRITCEHSEPLEIDRFDLTAKMIEQKITPQETEKFQKGMQLNIDGYAKIRDGSNKITQERISITTIPNV